MTLLSESIENYERAINDDVQSIINIFREQYCTMIENFSVYKNNNCTDCGISIRKIFTQEIKEAILTHKDIRWFRQVQEIIFIRGDYSNIFFADMTCFSGDFYYEIWSEIKKYIGKSESSRLSPEQELGLDVLDYEHENFSRFTGPLIEFIKEIDYQSKYITICETLSLLQNEIFKNIDDVTIL